VECASKINLLHCRSGSSRLATGSNPLRRYASVFLPSRDRRKSPTLSRETEISLRASPCVCACRNPWANCAHVDLMEPHIQCGRFRPKAKIEIGCIDKKRICDAGTLVLAGGLPLAEGLVRKTYICATRVIVKVVLRDV